MNPIRRLAFWLWMLLCPLAVRAQTPASGAVSGIVTDAATREPLENASVVLRSPSDSTQVMGATTGPNGAFAFVAVPFGTYVVECSLIGHASVRSPAFTLGQASPRMALHDLALKPSALLLDEVEVATEKSLFHHAIDRRVYQVDHDVMAKSGTASDVLQNIPSVEVDLDGNVSLRGSTDVMILVNGKKSPLMGRSRADVLQQLPAAGIEKIEVITNPSARFTPEGTSGIINIVMKKDAGAGWSGDATGHLGTTGRQNENVTLGAHPGKLDLFGSYSYRDDRRKRLGTDDRLLAGAGAPTSYREADQVAARPYVNMGTAGLTWHATPKDQLELSGEGFRRNPTRNEWSTIVWRDAGGAVLTDYDRSQTGGERETESGVTGAFQHDFAKEDHQLRIEANASNTPQTETAHFVERFRTPARPDAASDVTLAQSERQTHLNVDYTGPLGDAAKIEAGYALETQRQDIRSDADSLDQSLQQVVADPARTYRFRLNQTIHALYATWERGFDKWSLMGGLRGETARVAPDLLSAGSAFADVYSSLYPTLHLNYKPGERSELQLSYSRRIRRPESDDLNPFPEFTDPYNMEAGNPRLKPESTHSLELGCRLLREHVTFAPSLYYRAKTDGFTRVTVAVTDSTFLRTPANLARDQSAGFEPVVTLSLGRALQANVNANVFYEQIDASNLGFADRRSVWSWSGTGNLNLTPRAGTMFEIRSNYRSARLTPQGDSHPSFVMNVGARQNFARDRLSLTLAISDLLKTQRQETDLDVAGIQQRVSVRRDSQIFYAGLTYHYGRAEKKKDRPLQYEDQP